MVSVETNAPGSCMAWLYTRVSLPDFEGFSYTILTEAATGSLQSLHPRMPIMLDESAYQSWVSGANLAALPRVASERIRFHKVGKAVGKVGNDCPELILPMGE